MEKYRYGPFGGLYSQDSAGVDDEAYRYTGKPYDDPTGLYYYGVRFYDPAIGRFITQDPAQDGLNWYAYCNNNPLAYVDPDGEIPLPVITGGVGAVIGGGVEAYRSYKQEGHVNWRRVANGAVAGAVVGAVGGAWGEFIAGGTAAVGASEAANELSQLSRVGGEAAAADKAGNLSKWIDRAGNIIYPKNDGFAGPVKNLVLKPGTLIDRFGTDLGRFVSPEGTPIQMRSLPPGTEEAKYSVFEVVKSIEAIGGKTAPWFDQPGGGVQYKLSMSVKELLEGGFIRRVAP